jgi:Lon protease-like protein
MMSRLSYNDYTSSHTIWAAMFKLPLFPLNTVLFPGMPLSLHIFEERYKRMIAACLDTRQPFGVVLIKSGQEAHGSLAQPYTIGCTAQINQVEPVGEGRMNIVAVGQERFKVVSLERDMPYLVGQVEFFPLDNSGDLNSAARRLRPWVERYITMLSRAEDLQFDFKQLPTQALPLTYLAASLLRIAPHQKQALLAVERADELIREVTVSYRREVTLLQMLLAEGKVEEQGRFTLN